MAFKLRILLYLYQSESLKPNSRDKLGLNHFRLSPTLAICNRMFSILKEHESLTGRVYETYSITWCGCGWGWGEGTPTTSDSRNDIYNWSCATFNKVIQTPSVIQGITKLDRERWTIREKERLQQRESSQYPYGEEIFITDPLRRATKLFEPQKHH